MDKFIIPFELINAIKKEECVLFVASGLSSQVKRSNGGTLPNWSDFLLELLDWAIKKHVPFNSEPSEIKDMINKGNHLMAAEELQEIMNSNDFSEFLNEIFRDPKVKPTEVHKSLTKIPFRAILTTNYDTLIEGAYTISAGGQIPKTITISDINSALPSLRKKDFFIFKMHGDIDRHENLILGSRSYNNLLHKSPEYLSFLEILFTTQTVLFIGFGGSDPDLDYLLDRLSTIFSRTLNKHYVLTSNSKFNFTEKRRLLLDKRLEVIEYNPKDNHKQVSVFLKEILKCLENRNTKVLDEQEEQTYVLIIEHEIKNISENKLISFIESLSDFQLSMLTSYSTIFNNSDNINPLEDLYDDNFYYCPSIALIVLSKKSEKSMNFDLEVDKLLLQELDERVTIILIVIGNIDIPYKLRNYQAIKIFDDYKPEDLEYIKAALIRAKKNKIMNKDI